jgi:hypothetical protein
MSGIIDRIKRAASLTLRAVEFGFYHVLLSTVDRVSRLPRHTTMPEVARLDRENIALKAQLDALEAEFAQRTEPAPTPMATRAAQVFSYLLTREAELASQARPRCGPRSRTWRPRLSALRGSSRAPARRRRPRTSTRTSRAAGTRCRVATPLCASREGRPCAACSCDAIATWLKKDRRLARLAGAYEGAPIELLPTGTAFQIKRHGEDDRFVDSPPCAQRNAA